MCPTDRPFSYPMRSEFFNPDYPYNLYMSKLHPYGGILHPSSRYESDQASVYDPQYIPYDQSFGDPQPDIPLMHPLSYYPPNTLDQITRVEYLVEDHQNSDHKECTEDRNLVPDLTCIVKRVENTTVWVEL
ncbi:hypothetical protein PIB30_059426 [Stylosanthes scabra]|uniref:Uncharacterized protein n=1 Tax=Stylosanthes scabra TaxID=79078 RepID=A0ABU6SKA7_9FABA|nr:hypothetical protein [Stylosanthes scabra]